MLQLIDTEANASRWLFVLDAETQVRAPLSEESVEMEHKGGGWMRGCVSGAVTRMPSEQEASIEVWAWSVGPA